MARIFDVIEYATEMNDEIVHRFPETGIGDFRIGSQVIVRESQAAVFFRDGNALDVFKAGRHTIATANIPKLIDWIGKAFNDRTPFPAEVYFVSMKEFASKKWGTPQPIIIRNPNMGLGVALLQGFGTYSFQVKDPQQFVTQIVGTTGTYRTSEIEGRLRTMLLSKLQDVLGETAAKNSVPEIIGLTEEIGAAVRAKAKEDFEAVGLMLKTFYVGNLKPSTTSAQELARYGYARCANHTQLQAADAMRDAAQNEGGELVSPLVSLGWVSAISWGRLYKAVSRWIVGGGAAAMPGYMTPAEAAKFMKVTEDDILGAIKTKSLNQKSRQGISYQQG